MSAQTPMMLLTTSTSPGTERSPVSIALRKDCLDCIQSRCSAPLSLVTMNSVLGKGSTVPNTVEAVFCKQRFSNLTSKVGLSNTPHMHPLPKSPCSSQQGCVTPPEIEPKEAPLPTAHKTCPRMTSSLLASP